MKLVRGRFASRFFGIVMAASMLGGCNTSTERAELSAVGEAESQPGPYRSLASIHDEEELKRDFDQLLRSDDPKKEISEKIDRINRLHFRSQSYLKEFDQKLDQAYQANAAGQRIARPVIAEESYAKLIAAWFLTEDLRAKLVHSYEKVAELSSGTAVSVDASTRETAKKAREAFSSALKENASGAKAIALQSLFLDLSRSKAAQIPGERENPFSVSKFASAKLSGVNKDIKLKGKSENKAGSTKSDDYSREVQRALEDQEITNEIESLVPAVRFEVLSNLLNREPAASGQIYPDPGPNGNLTGNTFRSGTWALTYDDGPHPQHTAAILSELNRYQLKATFFWLAKNVSGYKKIVDQVRKSGMSLGNHSFTHANLPKVSLEQLEYEIVRSSETEANVYGFRPKIFRCPYGACGGGNSVIRRMIADYGMVHVFWNIDSLDWQDRDPNSIYERVRKQMQLQGRGIILFHDIHQQSVDASKMLIKHLANGERANAYRVLTIESAIKELNNQ